MMSMSQAKHRSNHPKLIYEFVLPRVNNSHSTIPKDQLKRIRILNTAI